ncbi:MAG: hypothetical protein LC640_03900 [Frankia sp.]|nr:hypothetical protein [Frankia sp.]
MASSTMRRRRRARTGSPPDSPTPHELVAAPELAILAALQNLIELSTRALLAAHPELIGEWSHLHPPDAQAVHADRLIRLASRLANATTRYHTAALAALERPDTDDDIPF